MSELANLYQIEHSFLNLALEYFQYTKYNFVDPPWIIDKLPENYSDIQISQINFLTNNTYLPNLPEQPILNSYLNDELSHKKYYNLIPCYNKTDSTNIHCSMEVGLVDLTQYQSLKEYYDTLYQTLADVSYFIQSIIGDYNLSIDIIKVNDSFYQITCNEIQISKCTLNYYEKEDLYWISAIGINEPLLSDILKNNLNN